MSVDSCCCCSLKTGGMIIGVLEIINGIWLILTSLIPLGVGVVIHGDSKRYGHDQGATAVVTLFLIVAAIWLLLGVVSIVFGIILLYAIKKESTYLLKVWIIFQTIMLILSIGLDVATFAIAFTWQMFILDLIGTILSIWFISVVYYLRKEIKEG